MGDKKNLVFISHASGDNDIGFHLKLVQPKHLILKLSKIKSLLNQFLHRV